MIDGASPVSPAAERMRRFRERRRRGLSCIKVQLRRNEVDALIAGKLSEPKEYISSASRQHQSPLPRSGKVDMPPTSALAVGIKFDRQPSVTTRHVTPQMGSKSAPSDHSSAVSDRLQKP
jgi:hypothetical protein